MLRSEKSYFKLKVAIGLLISVVIVLVAVIAYGAWKISDLSSSSSEVHGSTTTQSPSTSTVSPPTSPQPPSPGKWQSFNAKLTETTVLHVWLKATDKTKKAGLYANVGKYGGKELLTSTSITDYFSYSELALNHEGQVEISWDTSTTTLSYVYSFEPDNVLNKGICPLFISSKAKRPDSKGSFHFRPPLGWNNDPNGFSRTSDGRYHLFYQHYPHERKWNYMHWGHATSMDMVNWVHQPIFLRPEHFEDGKVSMIFSGAAHTFADGNLMAFYTDHMDGRPIREFQKAVLTKDHYRPNGPAHTVIADRPAELADKLTGDFRDPNVFMGPRPENAFFMTLGSGWKNRTKGGAVLLYKARGKGAQSADFLQWDFQGVLHEESRWGTEVCECSSMIPLLNPSVGDTSYVLHYGAMTSHDVDGRVSLSPIFVGSFDGKKFTPMFEQMLDFTSDSYAYLPFYDPLGGEALLIGWLGVHLFGKVGFDPHITLPRIMKLSADKKFLTMEPHENLLTLRMKELDTNPLKEGKSLNLPASGSAEVVFVVKQLEKDGDQLQLRMHHSTLGDQGIVVKLDKEGLEVVAKWDDPKKMRRIARGAKPTELRVFIDQDSIEVFGDKGRWAGTLHIPAQGRVESISFGGNLSLLRMVQVFPLKSTQLINC